MTKTVYTYISRYAYIRLIRLQEYLLDANLNDRIYIEDMLTLYLVCAGNNKCYEKNIRDMIDNEPDTIASSIEFSKPVFKIIRDRVIDIFTANKMTVSASIVDVKIHGNLVSVTVEVEDAEGYEKVVIPLSNKNKRDLDAFINFLDTFESVDDLPDEAFNIKSYIILRLYGGSNYESFLNEVDINLDSMFVDNGLGTLTADGYENIITDILDYLLNDEIAETLNAIYVTYESKISTLYNEETDKYMWIDELLVSQDSVAVFVLIE